MAKGLGKPGSASPVHASVGFGFIDADSTRIASTLDVCLGLFTKCLNPSGSATWTSSARSVCSLLARDHAGHVTERGLLVRPTATLPRYNAPYTRLSATSTALGVSIP
jgi:hypothetical protein